MEKNKVAVVIPAYNEADTIAELLRRIKPFADAIVVNDASKDNTESIVKSTQGAICISHKINTHIPRATLDGIKYAFENGYEYIITMDAGLSHCPEQLPDFINAPEADLVMGVRERSINTPKWRLMLSKTATFLINLALRPWGSKLPKAKFKDVTSGYRRYSRKAVGLLLQKKFEAKTFDFHTEALMFVYRNGLTIIEIPISYSFGNSSLNKRVIFDGFAMFLNMLYTRRK